MENQNLMMLGSYIFSLTKITKTVVQKFAAVISSMKFLSLKLWLYHNKLPYNLALNTVMFWQFLIVKVRQTA